MFSGVPQDSSFLPNHAAGNYGVPGPGDKASDFIISSRPHVNEPCRELWSAGHSPTKQMGKLTCPARVTR